MPGHSAAVEFREKFEPVEKAEYDWVEKYAQDRHKQLNTDFDCIDAKAGFVITFLGAGFGALTVGSLAMPATLPWWVVASLTFPVGAAVVAIWLAFEARQAIDHPAGPTVKCATDYVKEFGSKGRAYFLGQWHFQNEILKVINEKKANVYNTATRWAFASICLLTVPFFCGVLWRMCPPAPPKLTVESNMVAPNVSSPK